MFRKTSGTMDFTMLYTILSGLVVGVMSDSELQIVQSNGKFCGELYKILSQESGNVFFSPLSAHTVLSLSYLGSSGSTKDAYVKSLSLPDKKTTAEGYKTVSGKLASEKDVDLYLANKIYVAEDAKLNNEFSKAAIEDFNTEVENIAFAASEEAAKTINSWVEKKTANKIKDLFSKDAFNSMTKVILVNAIYFKGAWDTSFAAEQTVTEPFYVDANKKIEVQMMHDYKGKYGFKYDEDLEAKVLEKKFKNNKFSMLLILPNKIDGIKNLEAKLQTVDLTNIADGLSKKDIHLALPKFKIETEIELEKPLEKLGLGEIFTDSADFSDLLENKIPLKVDKVIQKAFIEVNEEGAEAAAATGMVFDLRTLDSKRTESFYVDHPFILLIAKNQNDTLKNILFMGGIYEI